MNVVLINPRLRAWSPTVLVPLGLAYVAAALEKGGHTVRVIDLNAEKVSDGCLVREVSGVDWVGITGMITEYQEVLRLTKQIKEADNCIKVVLGGPLATSLPRELLKASLADFVVTGEGEGTILNLFSVLKEGSNLASVKGIGYKINGQIFLTDCVEPIANLDVIPFPARHLFNMVRYSQNLFHNFNTRINGFSQIKSASLITSRGCPYSCTFCYKDTWGQKWRGRNPLNIYEEMEFLEERYGFNGFFFHDDTFVLDKKRVLQFCDVLNEKQLRVIWGCNGRVNLMTKELLGAMYQAGCREIAYGIESGSQKMLDLLKKNITLEQVRNAVKWTKEAGISTNGYFMIGLPGETKEDIRQTIAFAEELDLNFYGFSLFTPLPGTELFQFAVDKGLVKNVTSLKDWDFNVNINLTKDCSDDDLIAFQNEIFRKFTLRAFGRYYMFKPVFLKKIATVIFSLRNWGEAREFARRAGGIIESYWHKV
ncbi:MAG: radical SAM protein [Chloroflexota bacterium]